MCRVRIMPYYGAVVAFNCHFSTCGIAHVWCLDLAIYELGEKSTYLPITWTRLMG